MRLVVLLLVLFAVPSAVLLRARPDTPPDPLPSWNDTAPKKAIVKFVQEATDKNHKHHVAPAERIAVFDNDGTLWCEQPIYPQLAFTFDRVKALAAKHPDWKKKQPFKGVLENDRKAVLATGKRGLLQLVGASHAGQTTEEFAQTAKDWLATAKHPRYKRPYTDCVYQPMLELLAYLRRNGFKTYIVSGGGVEFMRVFSERVYGIPPEQVIGSTGKLKFELREGKPVLVRLAELDSFDDGPAKPENIQKFIGRRPVMAFGNSDGDLQMLQWTAAGAGPRFCLFVHHTDAKREWAYDRQSSVGKLDKGLVEAKKKGWAVASMKDDWKVIFPFDKK